MVFIGMRKKIEGQVAVMYVYHIKIRYNGYVIMAIIINSIIF